MRERPILFSGPLVRAIVAGKKVQTRRIVKSQPVQDSAGFWTHDGKHFAGSIELWKEDAAALWCPFGRPGDRLWVREAWARTTLFQGGGQEIYVYRDCDNQTDYGGPWKPSIHMPRAACRINLKITGVRVERLHDISREDAAAEGICHMADDGFDGKMKDGTFIIQKHYWPEQNFLRLWESIYGPGNPYVWVIEFQMVQP